MPSSPITDAVAQPDRASALLDLLATVPDPRDPRGVRYPLAGVLAVAVTAVLAGARSFAAIGQWAADLSGEHLARIGLGMAPDESTLRKLLARSDTDSGGSTVTLVRSAIRGVLRPSRPARLICSAARLTRGWRPRRCRTG